MADALDLQRQKYFQSQRENVQRDINANVQKGQGALDRRFASLGLTGSGAAIKAGMQNREQAQQLGGRALADINNQEAQANLQAGEAQKAREFQSGEAQKGREFQQNLTNQDVALRKEFFGTEQGNKLKQLDLAERQFQLAKDTEDFNKRLAEYAMNQSGQDGGILGTGISSGDAGKFTIGRAVGAPLAIAPQVGSYISDRLGIKF